MAFGEEFLPQEPIEQPIQQPIEQSSQEQVVETNTVASNQAANDFAQIEQVAETTTTEEEGYFPAEDIVEGVNFDEKDIDETIAFEYLKKHRGVESDNLEDFLKKRDTVKEVNPYADVIDDEDKQYLDYKKETGRSRKDFEFLNQDIESISPVELARQRIEKETGLKLSTEKAIEYLEEKFDIDLSDNELSIKAQIELNGFVKPIKEELSSLKEKYRQPIEPKAQPESQNFDDLVSLQDGSMMKKADYQNLMNNHQKHIEASVESVNGVAETSFKIVFDDNGTQKDLAFNYEYSNEDKQSMVSTVKNVDEAMKKRYRSENGEFNHKQFAEDMFWSDPKNREKVVANLIHKARAGGIEEAMKQDNNVNFSNQRIPNRDNSGQRVVPIVQTNGFGFPEQFK